MSIKVNELWRRNFQPEELNYLAENSLIEVYSDIKTSFNTGINFPTVS